jgi:hypothetical protein
MKMSGLKIIRDVLAEFFLIVDLRSLSAKRRSTIRGETCRVIL